MSKLTTLKSAIRDLVDDGDTVAIEGFTHLICFAAGHEIIRQRKRELELVRMTPDVIYDQMVGAGVARRLVFSWLGNPGVGSLHAIRRAVEGEPPTLELEEYSHFGMVCRYMAAASDLPFFPLRSYDGSDLPNVNGRIVRIDDPFGGDSPLYAVPPVQLDVAVIHVQRATADGYGQVWGLLGCQREAALAAERVIVVCEELVDEDLVRHDPNRTIIPEVVVDAVVEAPGGCHPSYAQGYYDRDNSFYLRWDAISRDSERFQEWLDDWVFGVESHDEYRDKLGAHRWAELTPGPRPAAETNYGTYG